MNIIKTRLFKLGKEWPGVFAGTTCATLLICGSVAEASDLQIYAMPTGGKKTIVMMLDTSGSMGVNSSSNSIDADYDVCSDRSTVQTDTGGSGSYTYTRTYCSVSYSTSGSSNYQRLKNLCYDPGNNGALKCYDRISRLQDGVFAFLNSNDSSLTNVRVGLGHYSVNGSGNAGKILVPAAELGAVNSTQRNAIKTAVKNLTASGGTPTAAAYAEAAAYLMGTSTVAPVQIAVDVYKQVSIRSVTGYSCPYSDFPYRRADVNPQRCYERYESWRSQPYRGDYVTAAPVYGAATSTTYYRCNTLSNTDFDAESQRCSSWVSLGSNPPANLAQDGNYASGSDIIYYRNEMQIGTNAYSGFNSSVASSKKADGLSYNSPLPTASDRVSCDGQGVYILSDGVPTDKTDATLNSTMNAALNSNSFSCSASGALGSTRDWHCMSNFAKKLFNGGEIQSLAANASNPVNVPIQTAFVGFGADFSDLSTSDVINACKLTSRTQSKRSSDDTCSPNQSLNAVAAPGYGNGGFFTAQTSAGVTNSVITFIGNIGGVALNPLNTGAISVPVDPLNPTGLQPYGYLRALEPDPASSNIIWRGNLKKYNALLSGTNAGAFADVNGSLVFETSNTTTTVNGADTVNGTDDTTIASYIGDFRKGTKDLWNSAFTYTPLQGASQTRQYNDGGIVDLGGAYSKVPMPANGLPQVTNNLGEIVQYAQRTTPTALRPLFTDVASATSSTLIGLTSNNSRLLRVPASPDNPPSTANDLTAHILSKFNATSGQPTLKDFPLNIKLKLLNYLGYPVDTELSDLPSTLTTPDRPNLAMGGSIHSFPVQLTYEGTVDSQGNLASTRDQSIMYGTMDGGLHVVNSSTGEEEMVFVPAMLLNDANASAALVRGKSTVNAGLVNAGLDGAWVADPAYSFTSTTSGSTTTTKVTARKMNVYGGLRMGGSSYYGLDLTSKGSPKFLFRIGADQTSTNFATMGQSWSKPVLANIRYNGVITRVMIVGGGYDTCYENPRFKLGTSGNVTSDYPEACNSKTTAKGNAVYMVNAKTGQLLWWASNSGANTNNANMKHSIVSRISTLDRNADGLIDHLYFGDLGGQVFRADLNNGASWGTGTSTFGVRVVRLANLGTSLNGGANTAGTLNTSDNGDSPRFYEPPTVTIHDANGKTFILVGIASGDRSTPLDVSPTIGREGMQPTSALNNRPTNKVYGIMDRDFINSNLISGSPTLLTQNLTIADLQQNPQLQPVGTLISALVGNTPIKHGWYRSLSSKADGAEVTGRTAGGMKAFEEPIALTGNLLVSVYDPEGTGVSAGDPCQPRVVGESDWQQFCLPFGVCLTAAGTINTAQEAKTGFKLTSDGKNDNVIGSGIRGLALVPKIVPNSGGVSNNCGGITLSGNAGGTGEWSCTSRLVPTRWYEKYQ